ncbi:MAG: L,D-transpeptidase family protein [Sphingomicrobium sp.]
MKRRTCALALFAAAAPVAGYTMRPNPYGTIDRCLATTDMAWNYRVKQCEEAPAGPVDRIFVDKSEHWMAVYRGGQIIREFRVALGRGGVKPKQRAGDGRVPEGLYTISAHNPASAYHLSLRISYPTPEQAAAAAQRGVNAGGDIMIHGLPNGREWIGSRQRIVDWTEGCIAVANPEMDWLYQVVPDGTPVEIRA